MIIGVDYHPSFQQIAFFMEETGEYGERQLKHDESEAERFYRDLQQRGIRVRVGMEATGYSRGSSDCWRNSVSSYGSAIPRRSRPDESRSKRPTVKMRNCC